MLTTPQNNQTHLYPVVLELEESTLQYIQHEYGNISYAASALLSAAVSALQHHKHHTVRA